LRWFTRILAASLFLAAPLAWSGETADIARAEQVGWSDPDAAVAMLEGAKAHPEDQASFVQSLLIRGTLYADTRQDTRVLAVVSQLEALGRTGVRGATSASHLVRAYLLCQSDRFSEARAELRRIDGAQIGSAIERFRLELLRGTILHFVGEQEASLAAYERALDLARSADSRPRESRALVKIAQLHTLTGRLDKAIQLLAEAQSLSAADHDEAALTEISLRQSDVAARSSDQAGERSASIQALMHARASGSRQMLALGLSNLADSYLRTNEYAQSLQYSNEALSIAKTLHRNALEQTVLFNMGIATIHVGSVKRGEELIEAVINTGINSGDIADSAELLHEYGQTLEQTGQWQMALAVFHRESALREQLLTTARQRSLLELEAKFNDVRKTREIEILKRDNALQRANLTAEQFRQKAILIAAALALVVCMVLTWAFSRLRKAGAQLRYASEHDTLTGLRNRRYFNDNILQPHRDRGFHGCLILIDVDHFKRINDVLGHPTGDAVLTALGERLSGSLRNRDTLVRWGGEEFLAVLEPLSESELNATVGRLLNVVETRPIEVNGQSVECTVSIGCARFPIQGATLDIALERAISLVDKALYRAKSAGRNRACFIRAIHGRAEQGAATSINASFEGATGGELVELLKAS
jgi:diguanylate cyclase (GGDEF)-like protein